MISEGYERKLLNSPASKRYAYITGFDDRRQRTQQIVLGKEHDYAQSVKDAVRATYVIARSTQPAFKLENWRSQAFKVIRASKHGEQLLQALQLPFEDILATLPQHHFNPLFDLLRRCRDKHIADVMALHHWKTLTADDARVLCESLEALVRDLREGSKSPEFVRALDSARRCSDKRWKSVKEAIRESFLDCSKLLPIRLDLHSHMATTLYPFAPPMSEAEAYGYMVKFERYLRDRYPLVRYIWSLEYGTETGFHFHLLALLNGHIAQDGVGIARQMGEHWENVITEGKGRYFNCNAHEYVKPGLRLMHCADLVKVDTLINNVAWYLAKTDIWMRYKAAGKAFVISQRYRQPSPGGARRKVRVGVEKAAADAVKEAVGQDAKVLGCSLAQRDRAFPLLGP